MEKNTENNENMSVPMPQVFKDYNKPKEPDAPFTTRHWVLLLLSFIISLMVNTTFRMSRMFYYVDYILFPGIAAAVCILALLAVFLVFFRKNLHFTRQNIFMLAVCVLIALTYVIFSNQALRFINYFAAAGTGALAMYSLAGHSVNKPTDAGAAAETLSRLIPGLFINMGSPFSAIRKNRSRGIKYVVSIALALLISVPILAVVLALLSSADAVFGGLLGKVSELFKDIDLPQLIWRCILVIILTGMLFSVLYGLGLKPRKYSKKEGEGTHSALTAGVVVLLLDIVYILFVIVQFTYFFGGRETALMEGGYAEYARSGFFQLVAVAVINIAVITAVNRFFVRSIPLTVLSMVLDAATGIILISAAWRMMLYIEVYGLSFLRILTLWGIFVISAAIVLTAVKMIDTKLKVFPVFITIFLVSWLAFNYMNVDRMIARYNVDMYLNGRVESVDTDYLSRQSPDVIPELERLEEAGYAQAGRAIEIISSRDIRWREWSFSELKTK